jgi:L-threonylcarbamoyladenylate synthase
VGELARDIPECARGLIEAFWPGPLTIILRRTDAICSEAVAGGDTVGLRMPDHPVALQILRAVEGPLAVTSANLSGEDSTVSSAEVLATLGQALDVLIEDAGVGTGLPSTVLDLTVSIPRVLRAGAVGIAELLEVVGPLVEG